MGKLEELINKAKAILAAGVEDTPAPDNTPVPPKVVATPPQKKKVEQADLDRILAHINSEYFSALPMNEQELAHKALSYAETEINGTSKIQKSPDRFFKNKNAQPEKHEGKYQLGDKFSEDFDYEGMLEMGATADISWGAKKLYSLYESFEDVNYDRVAAYLWDAIESLKKGDQSKAEDELKAFNIECREVLKELREEGANVRQPKFFVYDYVKEINTPDKTFTVISSEWSEQLNTYVYVIADTKNEKLTVIEAGLKAAGDTEANEWEELGELAAIMAEETTGEDRQQWLDLMEAVDVMLDI